MNLNSTTNLCIECNIEISNENRCSNDNTCIVAKLLSGEIVGRLTGKWSSSKTLLVLNIIINDLLNNVPTTMNTDDNKKVIVNALFDYIRKSYPNIRILCLSWKEKDVEFESLLQSAGYVLEEEKIYYQKDLTRITTCGQSPDVNCASEDHKNVELKATTQISRSDLISLLGKVSIGDPSDEGIDIPCPSGKRGPRLLKK